MKKIILVGLCLGLSFFPELLSKAQENEIQREEVSVVNIEVPVRVFLKGKPVENLTKADFQLFEGKKQQEINGFFVKKKKIAVQETAAAISGRTTAPGEHAQSGPPSRYFVLIFRITDYNRDMREALDYMMNKVLRQNDELLVLANEKTIRFNNLRDKKKAHAVIDEVLRREARAAHYMMLDVLKQIESRTNEYYQIWVINPTSIFAVQDFLTEHLNIWREYKSKYLIPDLTKYYNFARHLENIKKDKWVINFYQMEMFPKLRNLGRTKRQIEDFINELISGNSEFGKILLGLMNDLDKEMAVAATFPVEDISKLFYKVNATFHSVFIRSDIEAFSDHFAFYRACTDIENSLRKITEDTGGSLIASTNVKDALSTIREQETVYYLLTYAPENPKKVGRIKVKVSGAKYKVVYDDNMRANYIDEFLDKRKAETPSVQLETLNLENKKLTVVIKDFLVPRSGRKNTKNAAKINLRIRIKDERDKILYDKNKTMRPDQDEVRVSIPFKWLRKGRYDIIADVRDLMTGKSEMKFIQPVIR